MSVTQPVIVARAAVPAGGTASRWGFPFFVTAATVLLMAASAPSPFYPVLQERLDIPPVGITLVFAVYAVALLAALLTVGSLSDHVGRRPIVTIGFITQAASMLLLWGADSGFGLFAARAVQGLASGILLSALAAGVTDFAPRRRPWLASLFNAAAPMAGLALGMVFAGTALLLSRDAMGIVFGSLAAAYAAMAAGVWLLPETSSRAEGWLKALRPHVAVPRPARRAFTVNVPIIVAGWATGGLFFSLGPDIVNSQLHVSSHFADAVLLAVMPTMGAVAVFFFHGKPARVVGSFAAITLTVGTALSLVALNEAWIAAYVVAGLITGAGFGTGFMAVIGAVAPLVAPHQRAELFAALYTVSYLAFALPTVIAGALVSAISLPATALVYGIFVIAFAVLALVAGLTRAPRAARDR